MNEDFVMCTCKGVELTIFQGFSQEHWVVMTYFVRQIRGCSPYYFSEGSSAFLVGLF